MYYWKNTPKLPSMECIKPQIPTALPHFQTPPAYRDAPLQRVAPYTVTSPCFEQMQRDPDTWAYRVPDTLPRITTFTRYSPGEWSKKMLEQWANAENARNVSERVRTESVHLVRQTDDDTRVGIRESGRRLGERINSVSYWLQEVRLELDRLAQETSALQDFRRQLERALAETEKPLHVAKECVLHREKRREIDLVHDDPEENLIKELNVITSVQENMKGMLNKINIHLSNMRTTQHELEKDLSNKSAAVNLDNMCHQLNKFSPGLAHYRGIERMEQNNTTPDNYPTQTNDYLTRSQNERLLSARLRTDTDSMINTSAHDMYVAWNNTNTTLQQRTSEQAIARDKLHMQLARVNNEIVQQKKHIELLQKSINDKRAPLQMAQSRLEIRAHRPEIELCSDGAHNRLVKEVQDISDYLDRLLRKLQDAEEALQTLVRTRAMLESDLRIKANSIFIDRDQCLGLRKSFPYNVTMVV